ncbi:uncharacterized protein LOC116019677 [Ipomoea triloba]|uniref:uncharacterized protein LOC116019677 n=1 Tax=Ipomoea triloba TaxID=35885 RepID=UPI00125E7C39|nr:uncharacterized protein LOC116019677 [Ipomoea triloba]
MTGVSDVIMCRGFFVTLDGQAQDLFASLPKGSISAFADLSGQFLSYFASSIPKKKQFTNLCKLDQWSMENLADYLSRWKKEARSLANFDEKMAIPIFTSNIRSRPFHRDLVQNPPKTYAALLDCATRFAEAEEAESKKEEEEQGRWGTPRVPSGTETPAPGPRAVVGPVALSDPIDVFDPNKYYRFHQQHEHDTDECMIIKWQIEKLIQRGYLGQYVKRSGQGRGQGPSNIWKKKGGFELPHRDALVITLDINNTIVHGVLVDIGSSVNVMYYDTFTKLGLSRK